MPIGLRQTPSYRQRQPRLEPAPHPLLWRVIALLCAFATAAGVLRFREVPGAWLSSVQTFAGGAIPTLLAPARIPDPDERRGRLAGLFAVLGLLSSVWVARLELSA